MTNNLPSVGTEECDHGMPVDLYCDACTIDKLISLRDALDVRVRELEAALWGCIAAIERTHHCTEEDRLAAAKTARASLTTPESKP